jgi:hypothetical protein
MPNENNERVSRLIENIEGDLRTLKQLLGGDFKPQEPAFYNTGYATDDESVEGIFDGERMVDYNGKCYQVSPNYASKSKLVEGDPLKLYITPDGKFYYKQLGPIPRQSVPGVLRAEGNHYVVDAEDGNTYSILTAAVTYYMSLYNTRPGDRVMILLPAESEQPPRWAAIENIL